MDTPIVTFTSDFGTADGYVGAVKGVILSICETARVIDVTHEIPPQDVAHGAFVLHGAARFFPEGSIHLAIVDPGVGTDRRGICVRSGGRLFVGPDNGLFSPFLDEGAEVFRLDQPSFWRDTISLTFHGRDIFGPVAAHLAAGQRPEGLGPRIDDPVRLQTWRNVIGPTRLEGAIVHIDHFGNCISSFAPEQIDAMGSFSIWLPGNPRVPECQQIYRTYAEADLGDPCWLVGSVGLVELAVNGGSAAEQFGIERGDRVLVETKE